jgi:hypothetical protein
MRRIPHENIGYGKRLRSYRINYYGSVREKMCEPGDPGDAFMGGFLITGIT